MGGVNRFLDGRPQQKFVDDRGPTSAATVGQIVTFAPLPTLAPKAKVEYRVLVKGTGVGAVHFKTTLTSRDTKVQVEDIENTQIY